MKRIIANTNIINIGKKGENETRQIVFDISEWLNRLGEGTVALIHQRCGDAEPYPCVVKVVGTEALWNIAEADVDKPGTGECELMYVMGGRVAKSATYKTLTIKGLSDASSEVPEPHKSWVDEVIKASTGKSAYDVAVEEGFEGTVDEWLESLKGPKGDTPKKGVDYWTPNDKVEVETYVDQKVIEHCSELDNKIDNVEALAKGAVSGKVYADYESMIQALNVADKDFTKVPEHILVTALGVPDLWVMAVLDTRREYEYTTDEAVIAEINAENGGLWVGYFVLSPLETQKVDLADYAKKDQVPVVNATLKDNGAYTLTISVGVE